MTDSLFPYSIHLLRRIAGLCGIDSSDALSAEKRNTVLRLLAVRASERLDIEPISGGELIGAALLQDVLRKMLTEYAESKASEGLTHAITGAQSAEHTPLSERTARLLTDTYATDTQSPTALTVAKELVILYIATKNPAMRRLRPVFDDSAFTQSSAYRSFISSLRASETERAQGTGDYQTVFDLLEQPMREAPDSIEQQLSWVSKHWGRHVGSELRARLGVAIGIIHEEHRFRGDGGPPGPPPVLTFGRPDEEYERFSSDQDWMSNVVLLAKSTYVWLDQLSRKYERDISRIDLIPDEELDSIAEWGFTGLWLIGLWERSQASAKIKQRMGNPEAVASAYSLKDYQIAQDLGGHAAYESLALRAKERGIRLAADMVPNHFGLDSDWVVNHPERFLSTPAPPYPGYQFPEPDLGRDGVGIHLEAGYWDHTDAAVVFCRTDHRTGERRYIYHGNDGTHMPWNDTAQIDYLNPEAREAVIQEILNVARRFPIIRFDAAMTLARRHVRRLWYPAPGEAGAIPSRAERGMSHADFDVAMPEEFWREVVDRVATEVPDTLLLAEAFWLMEGYFVRTLGMHRVYNSAFMHMMKDEENQKYRDTIKNVLTFSPEVLKRFVNFQNNPDEETAAVQFGTGDKYFGVATMMVTMPGLPMWGHGQVAGLREKYGMEYRRAYFDESDDSALIARHQREIFPLMHRRHLFSQAANFALYDVVSAQGALQPDVYAFSNRAGTERALVVFNNRYQSSSGRLHIAAPVNIGTQGETQLVTRDLSDALELPRGSRDLVVFREQRSNQWFIRSAEGLSNRGLFLDLRGYECQVFLDFEVHVDAAEDMWRLHDALNGAGCDDLDEALQDLDVQPLVTALKDALVECETLAEAILLAKQHADSSLMRRHVASALEPYTSDATGARFSAVLVRAESLLEAVEMASDLLEINEHEDVRWYRGECLDSLLHAVELGAPSWFAALDEAHRAASYRYDRLIELLDAAGASGVDTDRDGVDEVDETPGQSTASLSTEATVETDDTVHVPGSEPEEAIGSVDGEAGA